jgi:hypothetical protein
MRHARVSASNHDSPRGATTVHPQAAPGNFANKPSHFWKLHIYPSTYIKPFN